MKSNTKLIHLLLKLGIYFRNESRNDNKTFILPASPNESFKHPFSF